MNFILLSYSEQEVVASPQRNPRKAETERPSKEKSSIQSSPKSPAKDPGSAVQQKSQMKIQVTSDPILVKRSSSDGPKLADKPVLVSNSSETAVMLKADPHKTVEPRVKDKTAQVTCVTPGKGLPSQQVTVSATTESFKWQQVPAMSRPLCDPLVPGPKASAPAVSMVQTMPSLARSVSAAGRLGSDPSPATQSYLTQSYRNAIMGSPVSATPASFGQPHSPIPAVNSPHSYSQQPPVISPALYLPQGLERPEPSSVRPSFSYGMVNNNGSMPNGLQWDCPQRNSSRSMSQDHPSASDGIRNFDMFKAVNSRTHDHLPDSRACTSGRQPQSVSADEFPHLDIINDLLNEDHGIGRTAMPESGFQSFSSGLQHLNHGFAFPGSISTPVDLGPSSSSCRFERSRSYHDMFQHNYSGGLFDGASDMIMQTDPRLNNGHHHMDGLVPSHWQMMGSDPSFIGMRNGTIDGSHPYPGPDYSNLACGVNGYGVFRPSNGI